MKCLMKKFKKKLSTYQNILYIWVLIIDNVSGLCVVALSRNLKLTTTLDRAITQNPCYVPFILEQ